jgi:mono/diheme cytochrome c family protein
MKKKALALIAAGLSVLALACVNQKAPTINESGSIAAPTAPSPVDEFAAARINYKTHCIECHKEDGTGGTVKIEDITLKVPSLKTGHALTHPDERLVKQILEGGEGMPKFKDKLSTADAAQLMNLIRKEFQGK